MLPAARVTDLIVSSATLGVPTPIIPPGAPNVLIAGLPAARMGDTCGADVIIMGSMTVFIGGLPAARMADPTAGGGVILPPCALTVLIGG
ncbi:PAAR domain-containing protein [Geomonas anaerohicana]|uniref:PAAR domain-containing protein n=1 Tax=Geomonas anaerohicana TaxID=2798583 RepID=A0ABS0YFD2_9BACT|nr:PAAR domain-containing protein [Geomonas anaerohicana]MBJ6751029.1 PAAR domain-containing protein [Geomonas anaerohicana]